MKIHVPKRALVEKDKDTTISLVPGDFDVDDQMGEFLIQKGAAVPATEKETKRGSTTR